jgi:hypothetical protein
MKNMNTIVALASGLDDHERRLIARRILGLSGDKATLIDLDSRFPANPPLPQLVDAVNGAFASALAAGVEGVGMGEIPGLALSSVLGTPEFLPNSDRIPIGALGPLEIFASLGASEKGGLSETSDDGLTPWDNFTDFEELNNDLKNLASGDITESALEGGVKDALKRMKERREKRKDKREEKRGAKSGNKSSGSTKVSVASDPLAPKSGVVITINKPESSVSQALTPGGKVDVLAASTVPLAATSSSQFQFDLEQLRLIISDNVKKLAASNTHLTMQKRDYARMLTALSALQAGDDVADALLLFPLDFTSLSEMEDSILPFVQNGASRNFKTWFNNLRANLAGLVEREAVPTPMIPLSPVEKNTLGIGDSDSIPLTVDESLVQKLPLRSAATLAFMDPDTYDAEDSLSGDLSDDDDLYLAGSGQGDLPPFLAPLP